ncbi:MAG: helix-turn-helix domain-containing protein [Selenomonadaceae bacterium]|nr:helix-turn-helix domain-containing protein [Selenomonadaceae bacterium]
MGIVQKNLLAELIALSKNKNGCYASNQYLAEFMQLGVDSIKKYIKNLKDTGYIDVQGGNYSRCITINWQRINGGKSSPMCSEHGGKNYTMLEQDGGKFSPDGGKNSPDRGKNYPMMVENFPPREYIENIKENIGDNIARSSCCNSPPVSQNVKQNNGEQLDGSVSSILGEPEDIREPKSEVPEEAREKALRYAQVRWQSIQGLDITTFQAQFVADYMLRFGKKWIDKAFDELLLRGDEIKGNKFSYFRRMLERWEESGSDEPWKRKQAGGYQQGARPHQGLKNDTDGGFDGILGSASGSSKVDICRRAYEMAGMMGGDAD